MDLSREELLWLNNALNEVLHGAEAIADWEFNARIGGGRDEVNELLQKVRGRLAALRRTDPTQ